MGALRRSTLNNIIRVIIIKDIRTKNQESRQEQMELATSREAGEQRRKLAYQFITKLKVYVIVDVYYTTDIYDL
jgi:uncharacterized membrane protein YgaE (UPF0421/DUF939 family)